jgi:hypothetical protein
VPQLVAENPLVARMIDLRSEAEPSPRAKLTLQLLLGLCIAAKGEPQAALDALIPLSARESQNVQVQGLLFHLEGLCDVDNPK